VKDPCPTFSRALPVDPSSSSMYYDSDSARESNDQNSDENPKEHFGGKDRYGCIPSAGYSWCKANKKCQNWEQPCPTSSALPDGNYNDLMHDTMLEPGLEAMIEDDIMLDKGKLMPAMNEDDIMREKGIPAKNEDDIMLEKGIKSKCCWLPWNSRPGSKAMRLHCPCKNRQHRRKVPGGDRDLHGCHHSAGYSWCNANKKCQRPWEGPCPTSLPEQQEARANHSAQPTENAIIKDDIMLEQDNLGVVPDRKEFMPGYFCPPEFPACWRHHRREELQG